MIIRTNIPAMCAYRESRKTNRAMKKNLQRLSSGLRINSAGDDAAGLSLSERMRAKITELGRAGQNVKEGLALARTADGALAEINDMLCRAKYLCVEAANGTYSDQELDAISGEINQLFSEVDRITAGTYFNTICLFRGKVEEEVILPPEIDPPEVEPPEPEVYEYVETVKALPEGEEAEWGEIQFIASEDFDRAPAAQGATAVFHLNDEIQTVSDLNGRTVRIGSDLYYFSVDNSSNIGDVGGGYSTTTRRIAVNSGDSLADAMQALIDMVNTLNSGRDSWTVTNEHLYDNHPVARASYDAANRAVVLSGRLKDYDDGWIEVDGTDWHNLDADGWGTWLVGKEGAKQIQEGVSLKTMDNVENTWSLSTAAVSTFKLFKDPNTVMTSDDIKNAKEQKLSISRGKNETLDIAFSDIVKNGMTFGQFYTALAGKINNATRPGSYPGDSLLTFHASYNQSTNQLAISIDGAFRDTRPASGNFYINEYLADGKSLSSVKDGPTTIHWTSTAVRPTVAEVLAPAKEHPGQWSVDFSSALANVKTKPFSFAVNGYTVCCYDKRQGTSLSSAATNFGYVECAGKSTEQILKEIANKIRERGTNIGTTTISGNKIIVTGRINNTDIQLQNQFTTAQTVSDITKTTIVVKAEDRAVCWASNPITSKRIATLTVPLGKNFDKDHLVGSGFSLGAGINLVGYQFTNGSAQPIKDYRQVDISACNNFNDVLAKIRGVTSGSRFQFDLETDANGEYLLKISERVDGGQYSTSTFTDGITGITNLMQEPSVNFSGGTNVGYSEKTIDFSSITQENLETLLGKGFRINCATCEGEYINIFFCWNDKGDIPKSFTRYDPSSDADRTIHNIVVELSKMSGGESIVTNIVEQVSATLNHYTALSVDAENGAILVAQERRIGDVLDQNSQIELGSVQTGVRANFTYSYKKQLVTDEPNEPEEPDHPTPPPSKPELPPLKVKDARVKIYVGSDPKAQFIPIHLPYLDLETLGLDGKVDLASDSQDAAELMERVDRANVAIASARGTVGADYNRLEHSANDLSVYHTNLTESESRIRDGDVAELMAEQTKLQILMQAQQVMMAQANLVAQDVTRLLQ